MKNRLEELRGERGWTQQQLAERVAVSRQTIISLERGRYNPSIVLAFRLAHEFAVSVEDLFLYSADEQEED